MYNIKQPPLGHLAPLGDFSQKNARALAGVSGLWDDVFAQALAAQAESSASAAIDGEQTEASAPAPDADAASVEPLGATPLLVEVRAQRQCELHATAVDPGRPLSLPIAELDLDLLAAPAEPFPAQAIAEQQHDLHIDTGWRRPIVLKTYTGISDLGVAQPPRPLKLPIAELELDLLDKPREPYDADTLVAQQRQLDYENGWVRPVVVQNLRLAA